MKYVYVLSSTKDDLYYEQCLMSVWSLRNKMNDANIIVIVDNKTNDSLIGSRKELSSFSSKIISVDFADNISNIERSRLIKTSIPNYIDDDFLFIDCDTIIVDDLSDIDNCQFNIAGVLDGHVLLDDHIHKDYFLQRDKKLGFSGTKKSGFNINGGLIFARKGEESKIFFDNWNKIWKYSAYKKHDFHDQSALNEANFKTGLKMGLLDGIWNCQPSHGGLAFLQNAKVIHYYSSEFSGKNYIPYYKLADKKILYTIKENGNLSDEIIQMIKEPKFQFNKVHLINDRRIVSIMQSPLTFTLADIKIKMPKLFKLMEKTMLYVRNFVKKINKK